MDKKTRRQIEQENQKNKKLKAVAVAVPKTVGESGYVGWRLGMNDRHSTSSQGFERPS